MAISYQACLNVPSIAGVGGGKSCVNIDDGTISDGRRLCANGTTPPLQSVGAGVYAEDFGEFDFDIGFWIGVNPVTECVWVGSEEFGVCASDCFDSVTSPDPFVSLVTEFLDELEDAQDSIPDWVFNAAATGVIALVIAGAIFYLLSGGGLATAAGVSIVAAGASAG